MRILSDVDGNIQQGTHGERTAPVTINVETRIDIGKGFVTEKVLSEASLQLLTTIFEWRKGAPGKSGERDRKKAVSCGRGECDESCGGAADDLARLAQTLGHCWAFPARALRRHPVFSEAGTAQLFDSISTRFGPRLIRVLGRQECS